MSLFKSNLSKVLTCSLILSSCFIFSSQAKADVEQCTNSKGLKIGNENVCAEVSGLVRFDLQYDTRQETNSRDSYFSLYPKNVKINDKGIDENAVSNFNLGSILTRGKIKVYTPKLFGADVFGVIEGDFYGTKDTIQNLVLRHSYVKMTWENAELLFGQYWSPLFNPDIIPQTVESNTGAPIAVLARFPQIMLTAKPMDNIRIYGGISAQGESFKDIDGKIRQENSGVPGLHLHSDFVSKNFTFGLGSYLRTIRPELTSKNFESGAVEAYTKIVPVDELKIRASALFGSDMADHIMTGGYLKTDDGQYKPLNLFSSWLDLDYNLTSNLSIGIFSGYTSNLGFFDKASVKEPLKQTTTTRAVDLAYLLRVSPRITYKIDKFSVALELEADRALYGKSFSETLRPLAGVNDSPVSNYRIYLSTYYNF